MRMSKDDLRQLIRESWAGRDRQEMLAMAKVFKQLTEPGWDSEELNIEALEQVVESLSYLKELIRAKVLKDRHGGGKG